MQTLFTRRAALLFIGGLLYAYATISASVEIFAIENQGRRALVVTDESASPKNPRGGRINEDDGARFVKALRDNKGISEVMFNSGGGSADAGLIIGRAIRRAGLSTRVPKGAICASACADAFMGGVARRVDEGGRYGIHMATAAGSPGTIDKVYEAISQAREPTTQLLDRGRIRSILQSFEKKAAQEAAQWSAYVLEMGGSPRLVELGTQSSATEMNWLPRQKMIDLNVINVEN